MKTKIGVLTIATVLMFASCLYAQGVSIAVSCSVPSIPGLNAPLLEKKSETTAYIGTEEKTASRQVVKTYYAR